MVLHHLTPGREALRSEEQTRLAGSEQQQGRTEADRGIFSFEWDFSLFSTQKDAAAPEILRNNFPGSPVCAASDFHSRYVSLISRACLNRLRSAAISPVTIIPASAP